MPEDGRRTDAAGADPRTDEELLHRCAKRDDDAFDVLYDRHADNLLRVCRRMSGDMSVAEDIAQEAFFTLWSKAKKVTIADGTAWPWLFTTAKFLIYNHNRKMGNQSTLDIHEHDVERYLSHSHVEETVASRDAVQRVLETVRTMPAEDHHIFVIHFIEGASHARIAKDLGITRSAAKSRIFRLRERLQSTFTDMTTS